MKKGFTLIELLAVIVILAIIALIATPIIQNIINDSREKSNKRSVELYGKAVEQAIAKSQLNGTEIPAGDLSSSLLSTVEYSGNAVTCTTNKQYEDGSIYLAGCRVGTDTKEYTYGIEQIKTIYRYGKETISIGDKIEPKEYTTDASTLGKNHYLKHVLDSDNEVIESYACGVFNGKEICLRGGIGDFYGYAENEADWTGNYLTLKGLEKGLESGTFRCSFDESDSFFDVGSVIFGASSSGSCYVFGDGDYDINPDVASSCSVSDGGSSRCDFY